MLLKWVLFLSVFFRGFRGHNIHGALKNQVQHFWEIMLHGKNLRAIEY